MINYAFNDNINILEVTYCDEINLLQILDFGEMIRKDNSLPRNLKILTDATSACYKLSRSEISEMMKLLIGQIKPYQSIKTAVIHKKPVETALSLLVDNDKPITGYEHKVFSTREAALKWLLY